MDIHLSDLKGWEEFQKEFAHLIPSEERLNLALNSAANRTTAWLRTQAVAHLSKILDIPKPILQKRFKKFRLWGKSRGGKLWLGLNGVPFDLLRPSPDGHGVTTRKGNHQEDGAFIIKNPKSGRMMVLKRRDKTWVKNEGKWERGPVFSVSVEIYDKSLQWLEQAFQHPDLERKLFERLEHELKWRMTR